MKSAFLAVLLLAFFLTSCGDDENNKTIPQGEETPGMSGAPSGSSGPGSVDHLKIYSYQLVQKFSSSFGERVLFHQLEVDRGAEATYYIYYKGTVLDPNFVYNQIRCKGSVPSCEVWFFDSISNQYKKQVSGIFNVSEDSTTNRRKIEIKDPSLKDYPDGKTVVIIAVDGNGNKSAEISSAIVRQ